MRNNSLNNTTKLLKGTKQGKLVLVRNALLLGLVIEKYKTDTLSINRGIVSTPNIVFHTNNTKCLIDFTNLTNKDQLNSVKDYFEQITTGMTLTIFNGEYYDTNSTESSDISGTYIFQNYSDGIVKANVSSVTGLSTKLNRYDKTKFKDIPYILANTVTDPFEKRSATIIKNKFGKNSKNSFNYMGLKVGDYIEIPSYVTVTQVKDLNVDSDGNEYILIDADLSAQDLTNKKVACNLFIDVVDSYYTEPSISETQTGSCLSFQGGVLIDCVDNNTISQCRFRSSKLKNIRTEASVGTFCSTPETDTSVQTNVTENLVQITSALVNNLSSISSVSGPINSNGNSKNSFYGRPF